jgi:predicted DNA-binding transcriptional regulator AlpA
MKKSADLLDLKEVAGYFGISESTVRRKVRKSRENGFGFVLPLFSAGSRLLWRRSDIESWKGEEPDEVIMYNPSVPSFPTAQMPSQAQVHQELRKLGVRLPENISSK